MIIQIYHTDCKVDCLLSIDIEPDYNWTASKETVLDCMRKHEHLLKTNLVKQSIYLVYILGTTKKYFWAFFALDSVIFKSFIIVKYFCEVTSMIV